MCTFSSTPMRMASKVWNPKGYICVATWTAKAFLKTYITCSTTSDTILMRSHLCARLDAAKVSVRQVIKRNTRSTSISNQRCTNVRFAILTTSTNTISFNTTKNGIIEEHILGPSSSRYTTTKNNS